MGSDLVGLVEPGFEGKQSYRPSQNGGAVAQLGERVNGIDEVRGSNPLSSTMMCGNGCFLPRFPLSRE